MAIRSIDPNLLIVLEAVVAERSISKAGIRLEMPQPAVSMALAKLRNLTGDELYVRTGRGVEPTRRARDIVERARPALQTLEDVLSLPPVFDPKTSRHEFMIDIAAGLEATILLPLAKQLAEMPGVSIRVSYGHARNLQSELKYGRSSLALDFAEVATDGYVCELLYTSEWVVVSRREHPRLAKGLSTKLYAELSHVALSWGATPEANPLSIHLEQAGIGRRVPLTVPTLASVGLICEGTDLVGSISARSARILAERCAIDIHPMPLPLPPIRIFMAWHRTLQRDPGHRWLRETLISIAAAY